MAKILVTGVDEDDERQAVTVPSGPSTAPAVPRALARKLGLVARKGSTTSTPGAAVMSESIVDGGAPRAGRKAADEAAAAAANGAAGAESSASTEAEAVPSDENSDDAALPPTEALLDDPDTDRVVDQITARESDQLLAVEDAGRRAQAIHPDGFFAKFGYFLTGWWRHKWSRRLVLLLLVALIAAGATWPRSRYAVLNAAGVRSGMSLSVVDVATHEPLPHVTVQLGSAKQVTDAQGSVHFERRKLGTYQLRISRVGFAALGQTVTLGWGSNPLGSFSLTATGVRYTITAEDFLSHKPIAAVMVSAGDTSATGNDKGQVVLTLPAGTSGSVQAQVTAAGYNAQAMMLNLDASNLTATALLVPAGKDVFVAKASGTYNVYSADVDGTNRQELLAGTGHETADMSLVTSPANDKAALVSARSGTHDSAGVALNSLTLVNLTSGKSITIDSAEQIRLIDWIGTKLVYELTTTSEPDTISTRSRLVSYDYSNAARAQLATAGQFVVATTAQGVAYEAQAVTPGGDPNAQPGLIAIKPDGSGAHPITNDAVLAAFRADYGTLDVQTAAGWNAYNLIGTQMQQIAAPTAVADRMYAASPDGHQAAWLGAGTAGQTLFLYDVASGKDAATNVQNPAGPLYWISNDTLLYRGAGPSDYVVNTDTGATQKVTDVAPTQGFAAGD